MLRRYLVTNGVSTVVMYAAALAAMPHVIGILSTARHGFTSFAFESQMIAPIVYRMITPWT